MNIAAGEPRFTAVSCNVCRAVIGIGDDDQRLHLEWHGRNQ